MRLHLLPMQARESTEEERKVCYALATLLTMAMFQARTTWRRTLTGLSGTNSSALAQLAAHGVPSDRRQLWSFKHDLFQQLLRWLFQRVWVIALVSAVFVHCSFGDIVAFIVMTTHLTHTSKLWLCWRFTFKSVRSQLFAVQEIWYSASCYKCVGVARSLRWRPGGAVVQVMM